MRFIWTPVLIIISVTGILGFFQNCTSAVPFGNTDHYQSLVNSPVWPYEVGVDQIAYMSCSEQEDIPNDGTFFTFRVGAFDSKGLRISQSYRESVGNVRDMDVPAALEQAVGSSQTQLTVGIRRLDNLQANWRAVSNGDTGTEGMDYDNFFPVMGNSDLNNILWYMEPGDYLRIFTPAQLSTDHRFEAQLLFMQSQGVENALRNFFNQQQGVVALTWSMPGNPSPVGPGSLTLLQDLASRGESGNVSIPPLGSDDTGAADLSGTGDSMPTNSNDASDGNSGSSSGGSGTPSVASARVRPTNNNIEENVYGAAIQPRFKQPVTPQVGAPGPDLPPRVLASIQDVVIDERMRGQLQQPWSCPDSMQFMIVMPEDAIYQDANSNTIVRCAMDPDPPDLTPELQIIRQSLYAEDFYVDMARRCIVPKPGHTTEGSCYGRNSNTQLTYIINYDSYNINGCGFGNPNGHCPHFASVCFRQ